MEREVDVDARSLADHGFDAKAPAVAADPVSRDRETEARALRLRREEGGRQASEDLLRDAGALVLHANADGRLRAAVHPDEAVLEGHAGRDRDPPRLAFHRLHRVANEIQEYLLEPRLVGLEFGERRVVAADDPNAFVAALELDQLDQRIEQAVDVDALGLEPVSTGEDHELVDQPRDAVDLADDQARSLLTALVLRAHADQLGGAPDPAERVADLVGDAGGDVAVGFLPLALADLFSKRAGGAAVAHRDGDRCRPAARGLPDVGDRDVDGDRALEALGNLDFVVDRGAPRAPDPLDHAADRVIGAERLA